eukprot:1150938-Pelagomonas_calceolata.AAC.1
MMYLVLFRGQNEAKAFGDARYCVIVHAQLLYLWSAKVFKNSFQCKEAIQSLHTIPFSPSNHAFPGMARPKKNVALS